MNSLFHVIEDAHVILVLRGGVWRQTRLFRRGDDLYAGYGSGFIRIHQHGTSCPRVSIDAIYVPPRMSVSYDSLGRAQLHG